MDVFEFIKFSIEQEHNQINELLEKINDDLLLYKISEDVTIGDRFKHMTGAEYRMASYLYQKQEDKFDVDETNLQSIKDGFRKSKKRHIETINHLTVDDLNKTWKSKHSGKEYSYTWLLYHFIEHLSTHRGQIAMAIRMAEVEK